MNMSVIVGDSRTHWIYIYLLVFLQYFNKKINKSLSLEDVEYFSLCSE